VRKIKRIAVNIFAIVSSRKSPLLKKKYITPMRTQLPIDMNAANSAKKE